MSGFRVVEADFHRNGVGGEPFYVGIVEEEGRRMLVTYFPPPDPEPRWRAPHIAVLDLDKAAAGNVYMHESGSHEGGNAWRGDHYQRQAEAIVSHYEAALDARLAARSAEAEEARA